MDCLISSQYELERFMSTCIDSSVTLTIYPLKERIDISEFTNRLKRVEVVGNQECLCHYNDVLYLHDICQENGISFSFLSTGKYFEKDGIEYIIKVVDQERQALKANLNIDWYDIDLFKRIEKSKFRSSFHLKKKDIEYIEKKGMDTIQRHAYDFVHQRLSPSFIPNDGKQTPMKGHPVFIAQHATACCCRGCLYKWHGIEENRELSKKEEDYIVSILIKWINNELERKS